MDLSFADEKFLRAAIEVALRSRENGNHPFGAILVDGEGNILLEAENTVVTESDCTGHAETNLMRKASKEFSKEQIMGYTFYTSAEPCPMCSGAIFWGGVRRVVFALGIEKLYEIIGNHPENPSLHVHCREILAQGAARIEVIGPALEEEAGKIHVGFWV